MEEKLSGTLFQSFFSNRLFRFSSPVRISDTEIYSLKFSTSYVKRSLQRLQIIKFKPTYLSVYSWRIKNLLP